jgi:hypothetical protein
VIQIDVKTATAVESDRICQYCQFVMKQGRRFRDGNRCRHVIRSPDSNVSCCDRSERKIALKSQCQNRHPPENPAKSCQMEVLSDASLLLSSAIDPCSCYDPQNRHTGHRRSSTGAVFAGDRAMRVALFAKLPTKGGIVARAPIPRRYPIDSGCAAALGFM